MDEIAAVVALVLKNIKPGNHQDRVPSTRRSTRSTRPIRGQAHARVDALLGSYPVYPEIDLPFLMERFGMAS